MKRAPLLRIAGLGLAALATLTACGSTGSSVSAGAAADPAYEGGWKTGSEALTKGIESPAMQGDTRSASYACHNLLAHYDLSTSPPQGFTSTSSDRWMQGCMDAIWGAPDNPPPAPTFPAMPSPTSTDQYFNGYATGKYYKDNPGVGGACSSGSHKGSRWMAGCTDATTGSDPMPHDSPYGGN